MNQKSPPDGNDPGKVNGGDRFALLLEGWSEDLAATWRILQSRWEAFHEDHRHHFPLLTTIILLVVIALAWTGQSIIHHFVGGSPPGPGAYSLVPFVSHIVLSEPSVTLGRFLILLSMVIVALVFLFGSGIGRNAAVFRALHLEKEPPTPHYYRPSRTARFWWFLGFLAVACVFVFTCLFVLASARFDIFHLPMHREIGWGDQFLAAWYRLLGLDDRPAWWLPAFVYILLVPIGLLLMYCWTRLRGVAWRDEVATLPGKRPTGVVEWSLAGFIAVIFTLFALHQVGSYPAAIQQDDGIGARYGMMLVMPGSSTNIFADDWLPYPSLLPRALTSLMAGHSTEVLRLTSAVMGGFTILAAFFCYRGVFPVITSLVLLILTASSHHVYHFSRVGTMHIDSLLGVFLILGLMFRAEVAPPGPKRSVLYILAGALGGLSMGLYPASRIGVMMIALFVFLRVFGQPDLFRHRVKDLMLLLVTLVVMAAPFQLAKTPGDDRSQQIYLLERSNIHFEFQRLDAAGESAGSVDEVLARHFRNAVGVFHDRWDNSHNYSTPFPASSPLVAALSLLGLAVYILRFRSTLAILSIVVFLGACFWGGALRFGPAPPSSSRMITLVPILMLAAGVPILLLEQSGWEALRRFNRRFKGEALHQRIFLVVAGLLLVWLVVHEIRLNRAMHLRMANDVRLHGNGWMLGSTELQRFMESHRPSPDVIYHLGVNETANQTYIHNDYFLPHTIGRRHWIGIGEELTPDDITHPGRTWFIVEDVRMEELAGIQEMFPGGRILEPPPVPIEGVGSFYVIYEVNIMDREGKVQVTWPWWW
ncbi:MAG: hypothetical protein JJU11_03015 [Candidatus Sumerlaeia bacterium]|nr:hypothetical protein [Candidatus Sumerlaeia bacterium]